MKNFNRVVPFMVSLMVSAASFVSAQAPGQLSPEVQKQLQQVQTQQVQNAIEQAQKMYTPAMGIGYIFIFIYWGIGLVISLLVLRFILKMVRGKKDVMQMMAGGQQKSALDVLKERYAKGEINQQEFEEKRKSM